jgi:hypothetical protein
MERNLLYREMESPAISPKSVWLYPTNEFDISQKNDLIKLLETSIIFGNYYQQAVNSNFKLDGRFFMLDIQSYKRMGGPEDSMGFTDKKKGRVYLVEIYKRGVSSIENALHEAIHLISHPLAGKQQNDMWFGMNFGYPLMEAVTQYFTRIMMIEAGIKNWKTSTYQTEINMHLKPFFKVFKALAFTLEIRLVILSELLFNGNLKFFQDCIAQQIFTLINYPLIEVQIKSTAAEISLLLQKRRYPEAENYITAILQKDMMKASSIFLAALRTK